MERETVLAVRGFMKNKIKPRFGRYISVQGRRAHLLDVGPQRQQAILLLHGCGSLAQEVIAPFEGRGLHIIALDRPGYGFSEPLPVGERGPVQQSKWLEKVFERLQLRRATLAAHSIACAPALLLAQRRPDLVRSLVLIAPFCRPTREKAMILLRMAVAPYIGPIFSRQVIGRFATFFGEMAMSAAHRPNGVPEYFSRFPYHHVATSQTFTTMADELLAFNIDMSATSFSACPCPTYVVSGDADSVAEPGWHLEWLLERIPHAEVRKLKGIGHTPHHAAPWLVSAVLRVAYRSGLSGTLRANV
jgi:pimeloyl-ACP methyl ester carboxylesterase